MKRSMGLILVTLGAALLTSGCGRKNKSVRDTRRDQIRADAATKRLELTPIAGAYRGYLSQENGQLQDVSLLLTTKDVSEGEEGEIDPVLVPRLAGYLRFNYSSDGVVYVGFRVLEADFDGETAHLTLKVNNERYKDLVLDLALDGSRLSGRWAATTTVGEVHFVKNGGESLTGLDHRIQGAYSGITNWDREQRYQRTDLVVKAAPSPPEGISLASSLRLYRGSREEQEFLAYHFEDCEFDPISGRLVMKRETSEVAFVGVFNNGQLRGTWSTTYLGEMGDFELTKSDSDHHPKGRSVLPALEGTYQGTIESTPGQANLPKRLQIGLVTSEDHTEANGMALRGGARLYLGEFGTGEYQALPIKDIRYNFYTHAFTATTEGPYVLTFEGVADGTKISGEVRHGSLGQVGAFEVVKQ